VLHIAVVVVVPHWRLALGPGVLPQQLQMFVEGVIWLSLEGLGQQADLDSLLALLTLPVLPEAELVPSSQQILVRRPDLFPAVQTILLERLPPPTRAPSRGNNHGDRNHSRQRPAPHPCGLGVD